MDGAAGSGPAFTGGQAGQTGSEPPTGPLSLALGGGHYCALRSGLVWCWGANRDGQLGRPPSLPSSQPSKVAGLSEIVEIQAGDGHTCALRSDGKVLCWGDNFDGHSGPQSAPEMTCTETIPDVGPIDRPCQPVPTEVPLAESAVGLALNSETSCAVLASGAVSCWGKTASLSDWFANVRGASRLALGAYGACAIDRAGNVTCSDPGLDELATISNARDVAFNMNFVTPFACLLDAAGSVWCWGDNSAGERGIGTSGPDASPSLTAAIESGAHSIGVGANEVCALMEDGRVECWGQNSSGGLGLEPTLGERCGDSFCVRSPTTVRGLPRAQTLSKGPVGGCITTADAQVWCWPYSGPIQKAGIAGRIPGPWEDPGTSCDRSERSLATSLAEAYGTLTRACVTKDDCVDIALTSPCYRACSSGPISKKDAVELQGAFDAASKRLCDPARGCATPAPDCALPAGELECYQNTCVHFDAVSTGCVDACDCQIPHEYNDAPGCAGVDLEFWGSAPCSACGSSSVHFLLYNRGQSHFHGLVTITASTLSEGTPATVPPAISQVIDVPSQGTNTGLAMQFDDQPGEVRVRLSAPGDCSAENDEYIVSIAQFGICQ